MTGNDDSRKDIIFVNIPPASLESPPIAIGALCEYLKINGLSCDVMDLNAELFKVSNNNI